MEGVVMGNLYVALKAKEEEVKDLKNLLEKERDKVFKLKCLMLLTDDAVSNVTMNELTIIQWEEFIRVYPEENTQGGS